MTREALRILMEWASKKEKRYQFDFAEYFHFNQHDVIDDELLGGRIDESTITSQMIKKLISDFERKNRLIPSFTDTEIHQ